MLLKRLVEASLLLVAYASINSASESFGLGPSQLKIHHYRVDEACLFTPINWLESRESHIQMNIALRPYLATIYSSRKGHETRVQIRCSSKVVALVLCGRKMRKMSDRNGHVVWNPRENETLYIVYLNQSCHKAKFLNFIQEASKKDEDIHLPNLAQRGILDFKFSLVYTGFLYLRAVPGPCFSIKDLAKSRGREVAIISSQFLSQSSPLRFIYQAQTATFILGENGKIQVSCNKLATVWIINDGKVRLRASAANGVDWDPKEDDIAVVFLPREGPDSFSEDLAQHQSLTLDTISKYYGDGDLKLYYAFALESVRSQQSPVQYLPEDPGAVFEGFVEIIHTAQGSFKEEAKQSLGTNRENIPFYDLESPGSSFTSVRLHKFDDCIKISSIGNSLVIILDAKQTNFLELVGEQLQRSTFSYVPKEPRFILILFPRVLVAQLASKFEDKTWSNASSINDIKMLHGKLNPDFFLKVLQLKNAKPDSKRLVGKSNLADQGMQTSLRTPSPWNGQFQAQEQDIGPHAFSKPKTMSMEEATKVAQDIAEVLLQLSHQAIFDRQQLFTIPIKTKLSLKRASSGFELTCVAEGYIGIWVFRGTGHIFPQSFDPREPYPREQSISTMVELYEGDVVILVWPKDAVSVVLGQDIYRMLADVAKSSDMLTRRLNDLLGLYNIAYTKVDVITNLLDTLRLNDS